MRDPTSILITGASSGIGAALARHYARPGVTLHLGGRDRERLEMVSRTCLDQGAQVVWRRVDVTDRQAMCRWIDEADAAAPISLGIANAGISRYLGPDDPEASLRAFDEVVAVNLTGAANTAFPLLRPMRLRGRGQIVLIGSMAGWRGFPTSPGYSASKAGVRALAQALRARVWGDGVAGALVEPGMIDTPMLAGLKAPKLFVLSAEKAAAVIARRLAAGEPEIAFPWPLVALEYLLLALPKRAADRILARW